MDMYWEIGSQLKQFCIGRERQDQDDDTKMRLQRSVNDAQITYSDLLMT
jgi:hypothetical protein